jgi:hypothetical protein
VESSLTATGRAHFRPQRDARAEGFAADHDAGLIAWLDTRRDSEPRWSLVDRREPFLAADADSSTFEGEGREELDLVFEALGAAIA